MPKKKDDETPEQDAGEAEPQDEVPEVLIPAPGTALELHVAVKDGRWHAMLGDPNKPGWTGIGTTPLVALQELTAIIFDLSLVNLLEYRVRAKPQQPDPVTFIGKVEKPKMTGDTDSEEATITFKVAAADLKDLWHAMRVRSGRSVLVTLAPMPDEVKRAPEVPSDQIPLFPAQPDVVDERQYVCTSCGLVQAAADLQYGACMVCGADVVIHTPVEPEADPEAEGDEVVGPEDIQGDSPGDDDVIHGDGDDDAPGDE